ncbi:unnamed protein product [Caenorhabditis bovis]|uniref:Uncharacterized protein n=1 Tax=Caenorhabditis bovis TaxID=2654633 RepID=A0A8S1EG50_9PELO|nr:unnamed protein product [Caenorhabditis bovis]
MSPKYDPIGRRKFDSAANELGNVQSRRTMTRRKKAQKEPAANSNITSVWSVDQILGMAKKEGLENSMFPESFEVPNAVHDVVEEVARHTRYFERTISDDNGKSVNTVVSDVIVNIVQAVAMSYEPQSKNVEGAFLKNLDCSMTVTFAVVTIDDSSDSCSVHSESPKRRGGRPKKPSRNADWSTTAMCLWNQLVREYTNEKELVIIALARSQNYEPQFVYYNSLIFLDQSDDDIPFQSNTLSNNSNGLSKAADEETSLLAAQILAEAQLKALEATNPRNMSMSIAKLLENYADLYRFQTAFVESLDPSQQLIIKTKITGYVLQLCQNSFASPSVLCSPCSEFFALISRSH